jgi:hypothetical protein
MATFFQRQKRSSVVIFVATVVAVCLLLRAVLSRTTFEEFCCSFYPAYRVCASDRGSDIDLCPIENVTNHKCGWIIREKLKLKNQAVIHKAHASAVIIEPALTVNDDDHVMDSEGNRTQKGRLDCAGIEIKDVLRIVGDGGGVIKATVSEATTPSRVAEDAASFLRGISALADTPKDVESVKFTNVDIHAGRVNVTGALSVDDIKVRNVTEITKTRPYFTVGNTASGGSGAAPSTAYKVAVRPTPVGHGVRLSFAPYSRRWNGLLIDSSEGSTTTLKSGEIRRESPSGSKALTAAQFSTLNGSLRSNFRPKESVRQTKSP